MGHSRRVWDISQRLGPGLPVWPNDTPFAARSRWSRDAGSPVNVTSVELSTHSGTHADAPLHYDSAGAAIDQVALEPYLGPAHLVDARGQGDIITAAFVEDHWSPGVARMLFRTFDRFPADHLAPAFHRDQRASHRRLGGTRSDAGRHRFPVAGSGELQDHGCASGHARRHEGIGRTDAGSGGSRRL